MELVDDERHYTMKKNFLGNGSDGVCIEMIKTNNFGYRVPPNNFRTDVKKFLFIGDSVPFGWCVNAEDSLPFKFSMLRPDLAVINGAIPSYSLIQAKSRLINEFEVLQDLSVIYLQIYAPASSYARYGSRWELSDNWHSQRIRDDELCSIIEAQNPLRKTYFGTVLNKVYKRVIRNNCFFPSTEDSDARYISHIRQQVQIIKDFTDKKGATLIVAPVTPSPRGLLMLPPTYKHAIKLTNMTLKNVSRDLGIIFFETSNFLKDSDFIDDCCHLSGSGAQKVAVGLSQEIANLLKRTSDTE